MADVYYLCYGSNLSEGRFREYLARNSADSATRTLESGVVEIPHDVFYAGHSGRWGGGVAYLNIDEASEKKKYRAYGLTYAEFGELFSGENGFFDPSDFPWGRVFQERETIVPDAYFYDRVVNLGSVQGRPLLSFTSSTRLSDMVGEKVSWPRLNPPGQRYIDVMARGRNEMLSLPVWEVEQA